MVLPLDSAAVSGANKSLDILQMIFNHGTDFNSAAYDGQTALPITRQPKPTGPEPSFNLSKQGPIKSTALYEAADVLAPEAALALLDVV